MSSSRSKKSKAYLLWLWEKLEVLSLNSCVTVDDTLDGDIRVMVRESIDTFKTIYPEDSFQIMFWEQQERAASLKDSRSMRWHPLFVKWCLYLRHISGKAYEMMRDSKCVYLPSQRTLRDYTHHTAANTGFSADVDKQIRDAVDISKEYNRYTRMFIFGVYITHTPGNGEACAICM